MRASKTLPGSRDQIAEYRGGRWIAARALSMESQLTRAGRLNRQCVVGTVDIGEGMATSNQDGTYPRIDICTNATRARNELERVSLGFSFGDALVVDAGDPGAVDVVDT